jgi:hypothetical protein
MLVIEATVLVGSAGFFLLVAAAVLVIIGVRREERLETLTRQCPQTIPAALARRLLGTYVRLPVGCGEPVDEAGGGCGGGAEQ